MMYGCSVKLKCKPSGINPEKAFNIQGVSTANNKVARHVSKKVSERN